jgi:hypothetical protein
MCSPATDSKCKKKAPRKIHKAGREKHKCDLLSDLFGELGDMLGELSKCTLLRLVVYSSRSQHRLIASVSLFLELGACFYVVLIIISCLSVACQWS